MRSYLSIMLIAIITIGCSRPDERPNSNAYASVPDPDVQAIVERVLGQGIDRIEALADSVDRILHPVPFLTSAQEAAFNRYRNPQQLVQARRLGISPSATQADLERYQREGTLVRLDEENQYWVIRELDYSEPYATADVNGLLMEIGERFQARLERMGLPPLRFEISSVLRTAETQAALRRTNPNAARGESTHQYGTTFDIPYSSFMAPAEPAIDLSAPDAPWLEPYLRIYKDTSMERVAARRAGELKAILGHVLREMQAEGKVMVTLEVRQPVYHMTVSQRY